MGTRREFLLGSLGLLGVAGSMAADVADKVPDGSQAKDMITPAAQKAIDNGLAYLARNQKGDGAFGTGQYSGNVAITSVAGLAFMAGGSQPGRGPYGKAVTSALEYVLSQEDGQRAGYLHRKAGVHEHGPMYSHGFGAFFLAECYGMVHSKDLRKRLRHVLKRAVNLIVESQNLQGGWRYHPESTDADISVTICQIMALRAARNAGFTVPKKTVDDCIKYVNRCRSSVDGGFSYMAQGGGTAFARTAAGVVALYSAGVYKGAELEGGLKYLENFKKTHMFARPDMHYFYGHYYAAQAMWIAGGKHWDEWYPAIRDELLSRANKIREDGSWSDQICPHYGTAMACVILQIPNNYLPILQK